MSAQSQNSRITYWSSAMTSQLSVGRPTSCAADRSAAIAGGDQGRVGHRLQLVDLVAREVQVLERVGGDRLLRLDARGGIGRAVGVVAAALRRDLVEEALRRRHVHHADDFAAAAGLPEDHHVAGVAAEALDVVVHPLQRHDQIGRAGVAGVRVLRTIGRQIERAEDVQPVVHADDHDVAELAERAAVVGVRLHRGAVREAAAVHPDHDRLLHRRREVLGPDVQILAVLVRDPVAMRKHEFVGADGGLLRARADRAPDLRVLDAVPRPNRLGQSEALGFRVADAEEGEGLALPEAADLSALELDHRRIQVGTRCRRRRWCRGAGAFGFSWAKALPATPATAPPTRAVVVPSIFRRFIRPNGVFDDSSLIALPHPQLDKFTRRPLARPADDSTPTGESPH